MKKSNQVDRRAACTPSSAPQSQAGSSQALPSLPNPARSRRTPASSLRDDISGPRNRKPCLYQDPPSRLDALMPPVRQRVATFSAVGSSEAAALATVSMTLQHHWKERALADKLVASLTARPSEMVSHAAFAELIKRAASLPLPLCYAVFKLIPSCLCGSLDVSGSNMEIVLDKLLTKALEILDVEHQFLMVQHIGAIFNHPDFRRHFADPESTTVDRQRMEQIFSDFRRQLVDFMRNNSRLLAASMAADCAKNGGIVASSTSIGLLETGVATFAVMPVARGLYMVRDADKRDAIWHAMMGRSTLVAPQAHAILLGTLIPAVADLETQQQRENAFEKILQVLARLPAQEQVAPLTCAIDQLAYLTNPASSQHLFDRLSAIANAAPLSDRGPLMHLISAAVTKRPPPERSALFASVLAQVDVLLPLQRGPVLEMLACAISVHPSGQARIQAYNAVLDAIRQIPQPFQPSPASLLFASLKTLPLGLEQATRVVEAFDFVRSQPVEYRAPMLEPLTEVIWFQSNQSSQLDSLDELLSLMKSQPPAEQLRGLASLYQVNLEGKSDALKFAVLRKLFREVQQLPDAAQIPLIGRAAAQATQCSQPYMRFQIGAILGQARILSPSDANKVLEKISMEFRAAVRRMTYDGEAPYERPHGLDALLAATDFLPDDLRIRLLADLQASLVHCPEQAFVNTANAIKAKVIVLPTSLLQQFLISTHQPDA